ncbi:MAG: hypothetical protein SCALA702_25490 [Melioribacteraceae bacterium]|nr:MAG: hypothetical protein SCALA702_25490 [Melioribacteraceae bacterium]
MTRFYFLVFIAAILLISCDTEKSGDAPLYYEQATKSFRDSLTAKLVNTDILEALRNDPESSNYDKWKGAFWALGLTNLKSDYVHSRLKFALNSYKEHPEDFRRGLLEAIITLYPGEFSDKFNVLIEKESNPKLSAMLAYNLQLAGVSGNEITTKMKKVFGTLGGHPILFMQQAYLGVAKEKQIENKPPLKALIKGTAPGKNVIFSFQRVNRELPGLVVIRKSDGEFVKAENDSIFYVPQFARASSDMPGFLTNGNTPMGIMSFVGFGKSENIFIGPTENLQLRLPYEADYQEYFHDQTKNLKWELPQYQNLLPVQWRGFTPILEAFYAGQAGRTEIISHGTTINPEYYKKEIYYPNTPSLGCLTALELWDENGQRIRSDQQKLVNALKANNISEGYFVVVDLDNKMLPVSIEELLNDYPEVFN